MIIFFQIRLKSNIYRLFCINSQHMMCSQPDEIAISLPHSDLLFSPSRVEKQFYWSDVFSLRRPHTLRRDCTGNTATL